MTLRSAMCKNLPRAWPQLAALGRGKVNGFNNSKRTTRRLTLIASVD